MHRFLLAGLIALGGLPAWADGIELPRIVRPTPGGDYVLRSQVLTTQTVSNLQYSVFHVSADGRIGDEIQGVDLRPARLNSKAGVKNRVLLVIPGKEIKAEQLAATCMWTDPPQAVGQQSQLLSMFRYCKLFTLKP